MKQTRVLVVDDEPRLVRFVRANLESVGFRILSAGDGAAALRLAEMEEIDLIVLDIVLPVMDGYEVCRRVREFSSVPIIMLTARGEEADKVKGLELGADDYLTKPFGADELIARVRAVLRRASPPEQPKPQSRFECGDLTIDFAWRKVMVRGLEVSLTPTEYKLLYHLATNAGKVMLHEELLSRVWGPEYREEIDYLRVYVRYLRQKIEEDPSKATYIVSRPGVGYMLARPA